MASTVNYTAHGMLAGDAFVFANVLPTDTGITEGTTYYVLASGLTANAFQFSDEAGGAAITLDYAIDSGDIYDVDEYAVTTDPIMPEPEVADAPTGLNLTSDAAIDADGKTVTRLIAVWDAPSSPTIRTFVFEYSLVSGLYTSAARHVVASDQTGIIINGIRGNTTYYGRLATQDVYGNLSDWATQDSVTSAMDTSAPATPTGLVALPAVAGVGARWSNNTEADLSYYIVEVDNDSAFGSINRTYRVKTNTVSFPDLTAGEWYARVRAVDDSGNASANTATLTLTVGDEFGKSVIEVGGFAGSWFDLTTLGLYNARFLEGSEGTNIAIGRTPAMPYWLLSKPTGTPTFNHIADTGLRSLFAATIGQQTRMQSDPVPVVPSVWMSYSLTMAWAINAVGNVSVSPAVIWTKADGSASATPSSSLTYLGFSVSLSSTNTQSWEFDPVQVPTDAAFAHIRLTLTQNTAHTGNATVLAIGFKAAPPENMYGMTLTATNYRASYGNRSMGNYDVTGVTLTTANQTILQENLEQGWYLITAQFQVGVTTAGAGNIVVGCLLEGVLQQETRWVPDTADTGRATITMTRIIEASSALAASNTLLFRALKTINAGVAAVTASESNVTVTPIFVP